MAQWLHGENLEKPDYGGDSSAVQDQLGSVWQVSSTEQAFAALLMAQLLPAASQTMATARAFKGNLRQQVLRSLSWQVLLSPGVIQLVATILQCVISSCQN